MDYLFYYFLVKRQRRTRCKQAGHAEVQLHESGTRLVNLIKPKLNTHAIHPSSCTLWVLRVK
jgi:hypothetical protein